MLSQSPMEFSARGGSSSGGKNVKKEDLDKEILRTGIIAEHDAVSLYEQMSALTKNKAIKTILLDIAREEKTHVGEFEALLLKLDREQAGEMSAGKKEVEEKTGR